MKSDVIEKKFLDFFKENNHKECKESSLIPYKDDSLLFTNSGMVQFKNIFLGLENINFDKVTTSQTCIRLGGKHNDLENIGKTPHHNTSFKMLGNFCFKNSSKKETITLAWNFITKILELDISKLYITVHENDEETRNIWLKEFKVKSENLKNGNDETNFWSMDNTGPCGYCTEIFYDISRNNKPNLLEIWNLVFIQFTKKDDRLEPLKILSIDTGMGLERIASIKQNVFDSFETDILKPLINITLNILNFNENNENIRIITDHIKTCILLLKEGLMPSNDGRGYILKKLIRRAIIKKNELNLKPPLHFLIKDYLKHIYQNKSYSLSDLKLIENIIKNEEIKFEHTLKNGIIYIKNLLKNEKKITSNILFKLYDTYGIPFEIIKNSFENEKVNINYIDFKYEIEKQSILNKKNRLNNDKLNKDLIKNIDKTIFYGYEKNKFETKIIKIIKNDEFIESIKENDNGIIIIEKTPFYSEKGGQIGDVGKIFKDNNIFQVTNTQEFNNVYFHYGKIIQGVLNLTDVITAEINIENRYFISINHSATHLLHASLKKVLGEHVKQVGSFISDEYLRFDFTHFTSVSKEEINLVENYINDYIKSNIKSNIFILDKTNDIEKDRIVSFGKEISEEFCAGTHVKSTNEIGLFKIIKEFGIGSNIRRIEAITNKAIIKVLNQDEEILENLNKKLTTNKYNLNKALDLLLDKNKRLIKENEILVLKDLDKELKNKENYKFIKDIKIIKLKLEKNNLNMIKNKINLLTKSIILFYYHEKNNIFINLNITKDINSLNTKDIMNQLEINFKIKGGYKNNLANGLIYDNNIENIFNCVYSYIELIYK